jgi:protein-export membrane protein SecD
MKATKKKAITKKFIYTRLGWLCALLLVTGSIAYAAPANWLIAQASKIAGFDIPSIDKPFVLGLDLQGGTRLEYEAEVANIAPADRTEALNGVRDVIERRINTLGVSEPLIQTTQAGDSWRVTVELAGISDINQAINLIGETPILEFKEVNTESGREMTGEEREQLLAANEEEYTRADELLKRALAGEDFEALAREHTENEAYKEAAGDIGLAHENPSYGGIGDYVYDLSAGTVLNEIVEGLDAYMVVKVEESEGTGEEEVRAGHLLVAYEGSTAGTLGARSKEDARAFIEELKTTATPDNFESLARANSDEPGAAENGGDLGYFTKGTNVPEFDEAVFAQETGTISDVVETVYGFHLIYKQDAREKKNIRLRIIEIAKTIESDIVPPPEPWKNTELTGKQLESAIVEFDQQTGAAQVSLRFDREGGDLFAELTKRNIGQQIAIFLDGEVISAPVVQAEIIGGQAVISGNFSIEEAKLLARRLQAGALPIPIELVSQNTVGASLGAASLEKSLWAGLIGFMLVAIYMLVVYRLPGLAALLSLLLYVAISASIFKLLPVTLTLSGIAGFILSIGIAVDANVLVFERLKEELKEGKGTNVGLEDAFRRAWPSIRDGHVTVLISCAVLFWFTSSVIKGFALTLGLGTVLSLFTAIVTTRTIMRYLLRTKLAEYGSLYFKPVTEDRKA